MSRPKPPRLYLKKQRRPRANAWYIRDGKKRIGTGCGEEDLAGAERALRDYLDEKYQAPRGLGGDLLVVEAVTAYLKDYASHSPSREFIFATAEPILAWWSGKKIRDVTGTNCRRYVSWRTSQFRKRHAKSKKAPVKVSDQTARHDLKTLRAAINWYKREWDPELVAPTLSLPKKAPPRLGYCLERCDVAARVRQARKSEQSTHFLGMSAEVLWDVYGHHHPKFQQSAAAATGKRKPARAERVEHLPSNLPSDVLIDSVSR